MYVKLFASIFDGSLYGKFEPTVTFIAMLALADRHGAVDMTPEAIAAKSGFPLDLIRKGLVQLSEPDPRSRSPESQGRRITLLEATRDWGWQITNYVKYRQLRTAEERREYFRQYKQQQRKKSTLSTRSTESNRKSPISDAESNAEADKEQEGAPAALVLNGGEHPADPILHESLPRESWNEWTAYRRERRWPMGTRTLTKQLALLAKYDSETQRQIIDRSINAGWQGLFDPKGKPPKPHVSAMSTEEAEALEAARGH